ncbi:MAG: response regulator [Candidatus Promineifilaceae bacterium]
MTVSIRVLIADDHPIVRRGIRDLLATEPHIELVGEATNGEEALRLALERQPDVVLMDLVMAPVDGIAATRALNEQVPQSKVLVLTSFATDDKVFPAIKAGALGYLIKDTDPDELLRAIRQVYDGQVTLHPAIARKVLAEIAQPGAREPLAEPLTDREVDVLKLLARGKSNQEIANELVIGVTTVYSHVSSILAKLHLATRTQAALYAVREGYVPLYETEDESP